MNVYCERCDQKLEPENTVYLVFDQSRNIYLDPDKDEAVDSLGEYPFGKACAKRVLRNGGEIHDS